MTAPYQYIVAGLPDIIFDVDKIDLDLGSFINEIKELVSADDAHLLGYVGYPIDNRNLINLLLKRKEPIRRIGNFTEEELLDEVKNPDLVPNYMQEFLDAYQNNTAIIQNMSWENQLFWLFYEDAVSVENDFLKEWFTFDLNLRNILTARSCRKTDSSLEEHIICRNEITDQIFRSNAPDFGLPAKVSWVDDLFTIDFYRVAYSEEKLAQFRLQHLEDMADPGLFNIETVMRVGIALMIVERWFLLDTQSGKERLEKIINDLEANYKAE